ncbi:MAG TPA: sugar O-acetyltransferase [Burkholderiales bacterium]
MPSEKEKMLAGEPYDPRDPELASERLRCRVLCEALNRGYEEDEHKRLQVLRELLPRAATGLMLQPPFYCDYGGNIEIGENTFFNFNCVVLDVAPVRIGAFVQIGPAVQIYAATHPMTAAARREGLESGKPVTIGDDVWIGGGSIICPGVTIGAKSVIGAGSVVTRDIPEGVFAAGNPCRVVRAISSQER